MVNGWLVVDKPTGMTSTQVVGKIRRHFKVSKLGHIGTLDPLATGVLIIALGEATKLIPYLPNLPKVYEFDVCFGEARDTDDREGIVTNSSTVYPQPNEVKAALGDFTGEIEQFPPVYSAIKTKGQPAYRLARQGKTPPLKKRPVTIHEFHFIDTIDDRTTRFKVKCNRGTYIRSLARDLGMHLGTYGHITTLRRLEDGIFTTNNAFTLEKILGISHNSGVNSFIKPTEAVLDDIPAVSIGAEEAQRIRQGLEIGNIANLRDFSLDIVGGIVAILFQNKLVAMAQCNGVSLRPCRVFNL